MDEALATYESQLERVTDVCAGPWFSVQLGKSRSGDEEAWRRISGSCLRLVLHIAKQQWASNKHVSLFDLIEEGNNILVRTIK
jgi:DNA-directed RNA polymerase sigma subunit (sigma70/sigma32)